MNVAFAPSVELGRAFRLRRLALGYVDGKDVAAELGWSPSTVSRLENGRRGIYPRDVRPLMAFLEVEVGWFSDPGPKVLAPTSTWRSELRAHLLASLDLLEANA